MKNLLFICSLLFTNIFCMDFDQYIEYEKPYWEASMLNDNDWKESLNEMYNRTSYAKEFDFSKHMKMILVNLDRPFRKFPFAALQEQINNATSLKTQEELCTSFIKNIRTIEKNSTSPSQRLFEVTPFLSRAIGVRIAKHFAIFLGRLEKNVLHVIFSPSYRNFRNLGSLGKTVIAQGIFEQILSEKSSDVCNRLIEIEYEVVQSLDIAASQFFLDYYITKALNFFQKQRNSRITNLIKPMQKNFEINLQQKIFYNKVLKGIGVLGLTGIFAYLFYKWKIKKK